MAESIWGRMRQSLPGAKAPGYVRAPSGRKQESAQTSPGGRAEVARGFNPWRDGECAKVYQGLKPLATSVRPPGENKNRLRPRPEGARKQPGVSTPGGMANAPKSTRG